MKSAPSFNATGGQCNLRRLRMWADRIHDYRSVPPLFNSWENTWNSPRWYLDQLQAGELVLPTYRLAYNYTTTNWDSARNTPVDYPLGSGSGNGFTNGAKELAAYCQHHKLPICIRVGNIEDAMRLEKDNEVDDSPMYWESDCTGGKKIGEVTVTHGSPPIVNVSLDGGESSSDFGSGDFFTVEGINISTSVELFTTNPKTVYGLDRLSANTNIPSMTDGADWTQHRYHLSSFATDASWVAMTDHWENGYLQRMGEAMPDSPLVVWLINNEPRYTQVTARRDWRLLEQYPGLQTEFVSKTDNRYEAYIITSKGFNAKRRVMYDRLRGLQPSAWRDVRMVGYSTVGGNAKLGMRGQSGTPDYQGFDNTGGNWPDPQAADDYRGVMLYGDQGQGYGLECLAFDGGSLEMYVGNPQGKGSDCTLASNILERGRLTAIKDRWARKKNAGWFAAISLYPSPSAIQKSIDDGYGYIGSERFKGQCKYSAFLMGSVLQSFYANNGANPSNTLNAEYLDAISETPNRNTWRDAIRDACVELWACEAYQESMNWSLDMCPPQLQPNYEFADVGPLAERGAWYALPTDDLPDYSALEGTLLNHTPPIFICRRDGKGNGVILGWQSNATQEVAANVRTADGTKPAIATASGYFTRYAV